MESAIIMNKMSSNSTLRGSSPHQDSDYHHHGSYLCESTTMADLPRPPTTHSAPHAFEEANPEYQPASETNDGQEFQCTTCGKRFVILARLQRHLRVHTGEKPFGCEFCDKTFSVKENLNVHRRIHTKVRPYLCSVCDRAFEHSGKLHRHMRTHTGERPHRCELCGKTFVQSGQLVIHMRAHTGEKPYVCEYCPKGFTCSKQLKVHLRTHTGEKPYACDVCGKTFGYNHVLKMHKVSHLGKKLYKCTLCDQFFGSRKALDKHIKDHQENAILGEDSKESKVPPSPSVIKANGSERTSPPTVLPTSSSPTFPIQQPPSPNPVSHLEMRNHFNNSENNAYLESNNKSRATSSHYSHEAVNLCVTSSCRPLTPPESPDSTEGIPVTNDSSQYLSKPVEDGWTFPRRYGSPGTPEMTNGDMSHSWDHISPSQQPQLAFFTTITGERIACPIDRVIRLSGPCSNPEKEQFSFHPYHKSFMQENLQETLKIREELQNRLKQEEHLKQREVAFCDSVLKVLESCIGMDRLRKLGYPTLSLDDIIRNTLKAMGTQACSEPSLSSMDRIKVNLRLLLECCVPDQEQWAKYGWIGKSIEGIVAEFLLNNVSKDGYSP